MKLTKKVEIVRCTITRLTENEAVFAVLIAEQEIQDSKIIHGDLRELLRAR